MRRIVTEVFQIIKNFYGCDKDTLEPRFYESYETVYESCVGFNKCDDKAVFEIWRDATRRTLVPLQFRVGEDVLWSEILIGKDTIKYIAHTNAYKYEISIVGMTDADKKVSKEYYIKQVSFNSGLNTDMWSKMYSKTTKEWWFDDEAYFKKTLDEVYPGYKFEDKESTVDHDGERLSVMYATQGGVTAGYNYEYKD